MEKAEMQKQMEAIVAAETSYEKALHGISQFWANNAQTYNVDEFVDLSVSVLTNRFGVANESY